MTGEICVAAAHVKERYDRLWALQQASARNPGWHRTGDVGHLDPEGRLWVEGRLVHVVTSPGGPVTPVGVEQAVEARAEVAHAAAVGVGPAGTQAVVAVVVPASPVARTAGQRGAGRDGPGGRAGPAGGGADGPPAAHRHPPQLQDRPRRRRPVGGPGTGRPATGPAVRVLVTGASGALGAATARALAARGDRVTVLQRRPAGLGLPEVLADVADGAAVGRAAAGQDAVVHLAARVGYSGRWPEYASDQHRRDPGRRRRLPGGGRGPAGARVLTVGRPRRVLAGRRRRGAGRSRPGPRAVRAEQGCRRADRPGGQRTRAGRHGDPPAPGLGAGGPAAGRPGGRAGPAPGGWCWSGPAPR